MVRRRNELTDGLTLPRYCNNVPRDTAVCLSAVTVHGRDVTVTVGPVRAFLSVRLVLDVHGGDLVGRSGC